MVVSRGEMGRVRKSRWNKLVRDNINGWDRSFTLLFYNNSKYFDSGNQFFPDPYETQLKIHGQNSYNKGP